MFDWYVPCFEDFLLFSAAGGLSSRPQGPGSPSLSNMTSTSSSLTSSIPEADRKFHLFSKPLLCWYNDLMQWVGATFIQLSCWRRKNMVWYRFAWWRSNVSLVPSIGQLINQQFLRNGSYEELRMLNILQVYIFIIDFLLPIKDVLHEKWWNIKPKLTSKLICCVRICLICILCKD